MATEDNNPQPRLPLKDVPIELQQKIVNLGGNPNLNLYKILSNNPILLSSWIDFAYSIRSNCTTSRQIRELMILRGAQLCNSNYEWFQHEKMAKQCGISKEKIDSINEWQTSSFFDEKEKIALELMESLIQNKGKINDQLDEQLKKYFTEAEYIELVLTGGFYVMVPTVLEALQIPTEN
jgi:alkylhydroperoxidase family enzyme